MGFDRGGWDERGTAVGGALRNVWKVSARSAGLWTDNPSHHITITSPTTLISALLSFCPQTQTNKEHSPPVNLCPVMSYQKKNKKTLNEVGAGLTMDKRMIPLKGNRLSGSIKCTYLSAAFKISLLLGTSAFSRCGHWYLSNVSGDSPLYFSPRVWFK